MHSFHHSRGRIFFDVLCALAVSASCAGAWMQTGATALLGVAAISALYGVVHMFGLRAPRAPAIVETAAEPLWPAAPDITRAPTPVVHEPEPEPAPVVQDSAPKIKRARKPAAKASKAKAAKPPAKAPPELAVFEAPPPPLSPLFEPEPFMRQQQRSMFGRKAG